MERKKKKRELAIRGKKKNYHHLGKGQAGFFMDGLERFGNWD
jgi:hypothetical protein